MHLQVGSSHNTISIKYKQLLPKHLFVGTLIKNQNATNTTTENELKLIMRVARMIANIAS